MPAATGTPAKMEFEMPRRKAGEPDTSSFGPDMKWSPEARARRSEAAKKAAATRARKKADIEKAEARLARGWPNYFVHSRVARWALSGVSLIAMMRHARKTRWGAPTYLTAVPYASEAVRG